MVAPGQRYYNCEAVGVLTIAERLDQIIAGIRLGDYNDNPDMLIVDLELAKRMTKPREANRIDWELVGMRAAAERE